MSTKKEESSKPFERLGKRIAEVRENSGLNQQQFADRVGVSQTQISAYERGVDQPRRATALNICREFDVNEQWLTEGKGPKYKEPVVNEGGLRYGTPVPPGIPDDIPIVGRGRGGRGQFNIDGYPTGEGYKRVRRPFDVLDPHAFAVEVTGESMSPRYEEGDVVVCSPRKGWHSGDYCVVVTQDNEALVKKVHERDGHLILSSLAPGYDPIMLPKEKIRAVHKIVWKRER